MSDPYIGEIKVISFTYPPKGWAFCNGQLLPIAQNQALFSILGTMYGGNGQTNFALPNLQGRMPVHQGINQGTYNVGQAAGELAHTLTINENALPRAPGGRPVDGIEPGRQPGRRDLGHRALGGLRLRPEHADEPASGGQHRRQPAAREPGALSGAELRHRPGGHLPEPELETERIP